MFKVIFFQGHCRNPSGEKFTDIITDGGSSLSSFSKADSFRADKLDTIDVIIIYIHFIFMFSSDKRVKDIRTASGSLLYWRRPVLTSSSSPPPSGLTGTVARLFFSSISNKKLRSAETLRTSGPEGLPAAPPGPECGPAATHSPLKRLRSAISDAVSDQGCFLSGGGSKQLIRGKSQSVRAGLTFSPETKHSEKGRLHRMETLAWKQKHRLCFPQILGSMEMHLIPLWCRVALRARDRPNLEKKEFIVTKYRKSQFSVQFKRKMKISTFRFSSTLFNYQVSFVILFRWNATIKACVLQKHIKTSI